MSDRIVVAGVKPYDGSYPFALDDEPLTTVEWGWIKRLAGYLPLTLDEGVSGADPELFCAFAVIAMRRGGRIETGEVEAVWRRLADAPFGSTVRLEADAAEVDDARPPDRSTDARRNGSGAASTKSWERSAAAPAASGTPGSATSASVSPTSLT